jgi:hypothetical protein
MGGYLGREQGLTSDVPGIWTEQNFCNGLYGLSVALFTRGLGWTAEETEVFLVNVRKDLKDRRIHAYWPM